MATAMTKTETDSTSNNDTLLHRFGDLYDRFSRSRVAAKLAVVVLLCEAIAAIEKQSPELAYLQICIAIFVTVMYA